jgi:hypothetical protein
MFFSISKTIDKTFPCNTKLGKFWVNHDSGWTVFENFLYKGFTRNGVLNKITSVVDIKTYEQIEGNFCIIYLEEEKIKLNAGKKQKFPVFQNETRVSNLYKTDKHVLAPFEFDGINIIQFETSRPCFIDYKISDDDIIKKIDDILEKTFLDFNIDQPFKLYITGTDTLLIAAYILKNKIPYQLVSGEHGDMDHFLCHHRSTIRENFWAYTTIQHWKESSILLTGGHGDETMLRDPIQAKVILDFYKDDVIEICRSNPNLYHSYHFLKKDNLVMYDKLNDLKFSDADEMKNWIIEKFYCDFQHWHLGKTLFFSPYDNLEILNLSLNLSYATMKKQLLDAYVSKSLIDRNRPGLLKLLSKSKNFRYYENLAGLYNGDFKLESL